MFQGSFGTQPWKNVGEEVVSESAAAATEGSAPAPMAVSAQQTADTTPTAGPGKESSEEEEDLKNDEKARLEEEQLVWDETVKDMMNMELKQRKDEGDMEGFERGSNYRLRFNIWKTEESGNCRECMKPKQKVLWCLLTMETIQSQRIRPGSQKKKQGKTKILPITWEVM